MVANRVVHPSSVLSRSGTRFQRLDREIPSTMGLFDSSSPSLALAKVSILSLVAPPLLSLSSIMSTTDAPEKPRILALFDVDGTLTIPRGEITPDMMAFMEKLSHKITVGIVGGSDLPKQEEQLGEGVARKFPWNFSQNGLVAYKNGELLEIQTISKHLGEDNVKRLVNWVLKYMSELDIPIKRGTFFEFRR